MSDFKAMEDMDLQRKCFEAAAQYVKNFFPTMDNVEHRAWIANAVAAGYSKGYRDRQKEEEGVSK